MILDAFALVIVRSHSCRRCMALGDFLMGVSRTGVLSKFTGEVVVDS